MSSMRIGALHVTFMIFDADSLKSKRRVLRSVKDRLMNEFNISVAEVGSNDKWQIGEIGIAAVSNDAKYVAGLLNKVEDFLETIPQIRVIDVDQEVF